MESLAKDVDRRLLAGGTNALGLVGLTTRPPGHFTTGPTVDCSTIRCPAVETPMADETTDPADELLAFLARAQRLEDLPRTGWLTAGVEQPASVASHSYEVCLIALWLADRLGGEIDTERVLRIALVHDIAEALVTDLPRPVKRLIGEDSVEAAERDAADRLLDSLPDAWRRAHAEYQEGATTEAKTVKAADTLQLHARALRYRTQRRGRFEKFWRDGEPDVPEAIPLAGRIARRLRELYESGEWPPDPVE